LAGNIVYVISCDAAFASMLVWRRFICLDFSSATAIHECGQGMELAFALSNTCQPSSIAGTRYIILHFSPTPTSPLARSCQMSKEQSTTSWQERKVETLL